MVSPKAYTLAKIRVHHMGYSLQAQRRRDSSISREKSKMDVVISTNLGQLRPISQKEEIWTYPARKKVFWYTSILGKKLDMGYTLNFCPPKFTSQTGKTPQMDVFPPEEIMFVAYVRQKQARRAPVNHQKKFVCGIYQTKAGPLRSWRPPEEIMFAASARERGSTAAAFIPTKSFPCLLPPRSYILQCRGRSLCRIPVRPGRLLCLHFW